MADQTLKLSGYLASAAAVVFTGATQSLASLTDNEYTSLTDEIDNSTNKHPFADWLFDLGSAAFTGADCGIEIFIVPCVDGTNYPQWTDNGTSDQQENSPYLVAFAPIKATTAACKIANPIGQPLALPQGKFKFAFRSRANVTLNATNTFYYRPHGYLGDEA